MKLVKKLVLGLFCVSLGIKSIPDNIGIVRGIYNDMNPEVRDELSPIFGMLAIETGLLENYYKFGVNPTAKVQRNSDFFINNLGSNVLRQSPVKISSKAVQQAAVSKRLSQPKRIVSALDRKRVAGSLGSNVRHQDGRKIVHKRSSSHGGEVLQRESFIYKAANSLDSQHRKKAQVLSKDLLDEAPIDINEILNSHFSSKDSQDFIIQLIHLFFHLNGNEFTYSKTDLISKFNISIIAELIAIIYKNQKNCEEFTLSLEGFARKHRLFKKRLEIDNFIKLFENALKECGFFGVEDSIYPKSLIYRIFQGFVYLKVKTKQDFRLYFEFLTKFLEVENIIDFTSDWDIKIYDNADDIVSFLEGLNESEVSGFLQKNFEEVCFAEITKQYYCGDYPKFISQDKLLFSSFLSSNKFSKASPAEKLKLLSNMIPTDCMETLVRSVVYMILYDKQSKNFNLNQFNLVDYKGFFKKLNDACRVNDENTRLRWADLVSNIPGCVYNRKIRILGNEIEFCNLAKNNNETFTCNSIDIAEGWFFYELEPTIGNFINVFNYIFGLKIEGLEEFCKTFSLEIKFYEDSSSCGTNVTAIFEAKNGCACKIRLSVEHAYIKYLDKAIHEKSLFSNFIDYRTRIFDFALLELTDLGSFELEKLNYLYKPLEPNLKVNTNVNNKRFLVDTIMHQKLKSKADLVNALQKFINLFDFDKLSANILLSPTTSSLKCLLEKSLSDLQTTSNQLEVVDRCELVNDLILSLRNTQDTLKKHLILHHVKKTPDVFLALKQIKKYALNLISHLVCLSDLSQDQREVVLSAIVVFYERGNSYLEKILKGEFSKCIVKPYNMVNQLYRLVNEKKIDFQLSKVLSDLIIDYIKSYFTDKNNSDADKVVLLKLLLDKEDLWDSQWIQAIKEQYASSLVDSSDDYYLDALQIFEESNLD